MLIVVLWTVESTSVEIPPTVERYIAGVARISKLDFVKTFDVGVPLETPKGGGDEDALIFYTRKKAMPKKKILPGSIDLLSAEDATVNCDEMRIVFAHRGQDRDQCMVLVPQVRFKMKQRKFSDEILGTHTF